MFEFLRVAPFSPSPSLLLILSNKTMAMMWGDVIRVKRQPFSFNSNEMERKDLGMNPSSTTH